LFLHHLPLLGNHHPHPHCSAIAYLALAGWLKGDPHSSRGASGEVHMVVDVANSSELIEVNSKEKKELDLDEEEFEFLEQLEQEI